jgi:hypothetical protein
MFMKAVSEGDIPGVAALIARDGKIVYYKAFGMADNPSGRALKRDDIFRIASQSKAITATAVMILWEEKFSLMTRFPSISGFKDPQFCSHSCSVWLYNGCGLKSQWAPAHPYFGYRLRVIDEEDPSK